MKVDHVTLINFQIFGRTKHLEIPPPRGKLTLQPYARLLWKHRPDVRILMKMCRKKHLCKFEGKGRLTIGRIVPVLVRYLVHIGVHFWIEAQSEFFLSAICRWHPLCFKGWKCLRWENWENWENCAEWATVGDSGIPLSRMGRAVMQRSGWIGNKILRAQIDVSLHLISPMLQDKRYP